MKRRDVYWEKGEMEAARESFIQALGKLLQEHDAIVDKDVNGVYFAGPVDPHGFGWACDLDDVTISKAANSEDTV